MGRETALRGRSFPLIALLLLGVNGIWWVLLSYTNAWIWATIFHSIQYLVIVAVFHARDQAAMPSNVDSGLHHAVWFYLISFGLGIGLFFVWPFAYTWVGFEFGEAFVMVAAAINIHHFIVDGFNWTRRRSQPATREASPSLLPEVTV